jgi:hypothetical protein
MLFWWEAVIDVVYNTYGEDKCIQNFIGKLIRDMSLGRHGHRWEGSIKRILKEMGCESVVLIIWLRKGCVSGSLF